MKLLSVNNSAGFFIIALNFMILFSCKKEPDRLALKQITNEKVNYLIIDTATVIAYSIHDDSVSTKRPTYNLLGSMKDPVFGKTTASIYTQFKFDAASLSFGTSPVCDSIVLYLAYASGYYGDTTTQQTIRVYTLNDSLSYLSTASYYSNTTKNYNNQAVGTLTFVPAIHKNVAEGSDTLPHIRLTLDKALGDQILSADATSLSSPDYFSKYFKGLYITADPVNSGGAILYLNLYSSLTKLSLYYNNTTAGSLEQDFIVTSNCANFTHFDHNYADANPLLKNEVLNNNKSLGDSIVYIQAMAGIRTNIKLPYINNISTGKVLVNKAELTVPIDSVDSQDYLSTTFVPPSSLYILAYDSKGNLAQLPDYVSGSSYISQSYDTINKQYVFNITNYIQNRINNKLTDYGLCLVDANRSIEANRAVICGTKHSKKKMKLRITYVPLLPSNKK